MRTTKDQKKVARVARTKVTPRQRATASTAGGRERKPRDQRIRVSIRGGTPRAPNFRVGGWLQGRGTYLHFGERAEDGSVLHGYGIIDGQPLYRLAKAIVRHFESDKRK